MVSGLSRRPGQRRVSAPSSPGSCEPLTPGLRPSQLVSELQVQVPNLGKGLSQKGVGNLDDSDSERTLDVLAEETPMPPPPVPPVSPEGCGPSSSTSRPPVPPSVLSGASSPIPYHVHRAVNQSLIREQSPGRMPPKKNFPSNSSSRNSEGGPTMDGLLDLLRQQSNQMAQQQEQF
ncbi:hypothetical protein AgCh_038370 [Apium graveolens]